MSYELDLRCNTCHAKLKQKITIASKGNYDVGYESSTYIYLNKKKKFKKNEGFWNKFMNGPGEMYTDGKKLKCPYCDCVNFEVLKKKPLKKGE